jgi:hypothetical protein
MSCAVMRYYVMLTGRSLHVHTGPKAAVTCCVGLGLRGGQGLTCLDGGQGLMNSGRAALHGTDWYSGSVRGR